jgi:uncharacterized membrane protein YvlD (DUF360 family)
VNVPTVPSPPRRPRLRVTELVVLTLASAALLWVTLLVVPDVSVSGLWSLLAATIVVATVSAVLRPLLALWATVLGWLGIVLVGLVAQAVIFYVALEITPGISLSGFWPAFWAAWLYAALVGIVGWMRDAGDDDLFVADMLRAAGRRHTAPRTDAPGVVIIQIDGLAAPLAQWAIQAGDLPTVVRWVRTGSHRMVGWRAQLPATTPASQAGILHGRSDLVPAFRWYEKESGRLTVTNHPRDAAYVEQQLTDGRGLLADGGVSVGNIFSGDAPKALLTMSTKPGRSAPSKRFAAAYLRPFGFARSLVLMVGEMAKELYQGHRQRTRHVEPRINRRSSYVALRALTNVVLRDVNVRLLAEEMLAGAPVMYCDFTDYDEVAHHAGPMRPESLASLAGIDRAIYALERVAAVAPRPYRFVVLSDHGQSQGATFLQRCHDSLSDVVQRYVAECARHGPGADETPTVMSGPRDEEWGPVAAFLHEIERGHGPIARLSRSLVDRHARRHADAGPRDGADGRDDGGNVVVTASGNLGFVYFRSLPGRATLEEIEASYPGLVTRLAEHDAVGFLVALSRRHGVVVIGRDGTHYLDKDYVDGEDPLRPFGPAAAHEVRRHAGLSHVGDLVVNSVVDDVGEVAAFEELVGCHGGLGGWQSEPVLIHPAGWDQPAPLVGADAVHRQLVAWLEALNLRGGVRVRDRIAHRA